jgi:hypothetical protein
MQQLYHHKEVKKKKRRRPTQRHAIYVYLYICIYDISLRDGWRRDPAWLYPFCSQIKVDFPTRAGLYTHARSDPGQRRVTCERKRPGRGDERGGRAPPRPRNRRSRRPCTARKSAARRDATRAKLATGPGDAIAPTARLVPSRRGLGARAQQQLEPATEPGGTRPGQPARHRVSARAPGRG